MGSIPAGHFPAFESQALADIKIIELSRAGACLILTSYLAELGATVFKVELPGTGTSMPPFLLLRDSIRVPVWAG